MSVISVQKWGSEKWRKVKLEAFLSGLVLIRLGNGRDTGLLKSRQRPRRKNRPGAFTTTEMVALVQFGTQWDIFHMSHYLSGYVLEDQVECSSLERTNIYLFRGFPHPAQSVPSTGLLVDSFFKISRNNLTCKREMMKCPQVSYLTWQGNLNWILTTFLKREVKSMWVFLK